LLHKKNYKTDDPIQQKETKTETRGDPDTKGLTKGKAKELTKEGKTMGWGARPKWSEEVGEGG
jgi:hypothetical protein